MDYDENDFQSQNFQLGEEDSKFSTNLRSFSLPKFDLDEHLRFDSLVETEVLLGMQGQANNWIDFPSGTSAVEFSSSSAVSCSISRHNNVWSEATSSESVDLLLKSMGEDETMNNKSAIMESNAIEPYEKKDDAHSSSVMNESQRELFTHLQSSSQASEVEESKTVFILGSSNHNFSSGDLCLADENLISSETGFKGGNFCDELIRTPASNADKKESCLVASHCSLSSITCRNQDDNAHKVKSMLLYTDETKPQLAPNPDKDSVGLVSLSYITEPSIHACEIHNDSFKKLEVENKLVTKEVVDFESNSDNTSNEATLKTTHGGRLPDDSVEDNDVYIYHKTNSCDSGGKLVSCLDTFSKEQYPEGQRTENNYADINSSPLLTGSNISIQIDYANQVTEECDRMNSIPVKNVCEKSGLGFESKIGAGFDIDSKEIKDDANKDAVVDRSSVIAAVSKINTLISPSSSFKKGKDLTDIDMTVEKKESLTEAPFASEVIVSADEDFKLSGGLTSSLLVIEDSVSMKVGYQNSVSYSSIMEDPLPIKPIQDESALKQKIEPSSSSTVKLDLVISEVNAVNFPESFMVNDSKDSVSKETMNLAEAGSVCVEGALLKVLAKNEANAVLQFPSPVKVIDFTPGQIDSITSRREAVKNGESFLRVGSSNVSEGVNMKDESHECFSHVRNENSVLSADGPISCSNDSPHISLVSTVESNPLDRLSGNSRSSVNMALNSSAKDGISQAFEHKCNDLKLLDPPIETRSFIFEVSSSPNLLEPGAICEQKSFSQENLQERVDQVKTSDISTKTSNKRKSKNESRPCIENKSGSRVKIKKAPFLKQPSETDVKLSSDQQKSAESLSMNLPLVEQNSYIECCTTTSSISATIPDLNSLSSAYFQQSFTDKQQVQLRAQIFVYGAINSGVPPDEAYMVSAFGNAEGGRKSWEGLWHALIAKFQNQESPASGYETPLHNRSVGGANFQNKFSGPFAAKSSGKLISSAELNSTSPFLSPLLPLSYANGHSSFPRGSYFNFSQTTSPVTPWRPSQFRPHLDSNSPWLSQPPLPGPWLVPSHSPLTESMQHITSAKDFCRPHIPTLQSADPILSATPSIIRMETSKKTGSLSTNKPTLKPQKARKLKGHATDEPSPPLLQALIEPISILSGTQNLPLMPESHPLSSISPLKLASNLPKQNLSEETCSKIELAKLHAEDATASAASSIKHCQAIWSQLASQKNSGLVSEIEEKLASAAVAAAAAASVAKAAAAAAKVASDVALHAKMMADEAISAAKSGATNRSLESGNYNVGNKLAGLTPISFLKGMDKVNEPVDVISAAREAAKRRIESASAATKHAENLDAIVKAAELAATAVAQAGTIVAMGGPLPFTLGELVDAGSEEFWKTHHSASIKGFKWSNIFSNVKGHGKQFDEQFLKDEQSQEPACHVGSSSLSRSHELQDETIEGDMSNSKHENDNSDICPGIQKGSLVEVMSNEDGLRGAWFSARVLDIKDNKAYVCYNDFSTNEGLLKEWIAFENEIEKAPRIRTSNFSTSMKNEGTRKRRREHLGSYSWSLGDHVEAWLHDRWWEGTIAENSSGDETKLTVHISAKGDNQVVHTWNIRPSLIWNDGQWMEFPLLKGKPLKTHEGDTPQKKRQRSEIFKSVTNSEVPTFSKSSHMDAPKKPENSRSLTLSAKDTTFSIGNSSKEEASFTNANKRKQGLQKEGSRVVFGVPKPGKKRKFMEVSKHYVAEKCEKVSKVSAPIKFAKYLMPQSSQKSKDTSKVEYKGKNLKSIQGKSQPNGEYRSENHENTIPSFGHNPNLDKTNTFKFGSFSSQPEKTNAPVVESVASKQQHQPTSSAILTKKNVTLNRNKGFNNHGKAVSEAIEPRRSNRRIQPTSRLLEGIQSSLIISKISSISHVKKPSRG